MGSFRSILAVLAAALALSSCTDAYEERGLCSYFDACDWGLGKELDTADYCKELGSCDDGKDPTEYTISGKSASKPKDTSTTGGSSDDSQ